MTGFIHPLLCVCYFAALKKGNMMMMMIVAARNSYPPIMPFAPGKSLDNGCKKQKRHRPCTAHHLKASAGAQALK